MFLAGTQQPCVLSPLLHLAPAWDLLENKTKGHRKPRVYITGVKKRSPLISYRTLGGPVGASVSPSVNPIFLGEPCMKLSMLLDDTENQTSKWKIGDQVRKISFEENIAQWRASDPRMNQGPWATQSVMVPCPCFHVLVPLPSIPVNLEDPVESYLARPADPAKNGVLMAAPGTEPASYLLWASKQPRRECSPHQAAQINILVRHSPLQLEPGQYLRSWATHL
nr:uncharacterized protein LOC108350366 [Rattus norvegicus]|eukprot:XP_017447627.1 PREDICTED: uncharacterized protein LOC108350366 isoform X1 [Rattus norvegicus]